MFNIGEYSLYGNLVFLNHAPVMSVEKNLILKRKAVCRFLLLVDCGTTVRGSNSFILASGWAEFSTIDPDEKLKIRRPAMIHFLLNHVPSSQCSWVRFKE